MLTIWKFVLEVNPEQCVTMPRGARLLTVHAQGDRAELPVLWAQVDTKAPLVCRSIAVLATGERIDRAEALYVGSAVCCGGRLVWHVFDLGEVG